MTRSWLVQSLSILLIVVSALSVLLIAAQSRRVSPDSFRAWACPAATISQREEGESVVICLEDLARSETLLELAGSIDLVCDPPTLAIWDVDQDGNDDLYFQHCGGHGYAYCADGRIEYRELSDSDQSFKGYWYQLVFGVGHREIALAVLFVCLVAVLGLALWRLRRRS